jgi:flagellar basal-body rod protein FlgB
MLERSFLQPSKLNPQKTNPNHLSGEIGPPFEVEISGEEVSIDREMARLAENNLMYDAGVQTLIKKLEAIRITLVEGGR